MGREIKVNRKKSFLFPPDLENWVSPNHPARFIDSFVDSLDLHELGFKRNKSKFGPSFYSSSLLLKVLLYAYFKSITSFRLIELNCHENVGFLWLTGMKYPDHNTLWRFYNANNQSIKRLFKKTVKSAYYLDLVDFVICAVDGTKIAADVSKKKTIHKKDLLYLIDNLDSITKEKSENYDKESTEKKDDGSDIVVPKKLKDVDLSKENLQKLLNELEDSETNHLNTTDKDARLMKTSDNSIKMSYNAQALADSKYGIIVAADLHNKPSDNDSLNDMISITKGNIDKIPDVTLADGGYFSSKELCDAETNKYNVLVNIPTKVNKKSLNPNWAYHISKFTHEKENDIYICPKGGRLEFSRKIKKKDFFNREYRCVSYKNCEFKDECTKNKKGRTIEVNPYSEYTKKHQEKLKDKEQRKLLRRRQIIIEPVFGFIKKILKFDRFTVRNMDNVSTQWNLVCSIVNLRKIYKYAF